MRLFSKLVIATTGRLCRRLLLPAGLVFLCVLLALLAGRGADHLLSEGIDFSGVVLAVTAPEGDRVPEVLENYLGKMRDVRAYCSIKAMGQHDALAALSEGEVTAVLILPEDFVHNVRDGTNPDVQLIVDAHRPLGSLLTLWVGQSLSELLASVQCGVYTTNYVGKINGLSADEAEKLLTEINLRYIGWVMNRRDLFSEQTVLPTDELPVALHYEISIFWFLLLSMAPVFSWLYQGSWLQYHKRLRFARRGAWTGFWAALTACVPAIWLLIFAALEILLRAPLLPVLGISALCAVFFAVYAAFCALVSKSAAGCGTLSFLLNTAFLLISGGIIPPALLPKAVQRMERASPITLLRELSASALEYSAPKTALYIAVASAVIGFVCAWLYMLRARAREAEI